MEIYTEVKGIKEKSQEERIFDLECQISMLTDLVIQLIGELKREGLNISDKLNDFYDSE
jgi:hypothetical protein